MRDYEGDFREFKRELESHGITKDMFDIEAYVGCTYAELRGLVRAVIYNVEKRRKELVNVAEGH